MVIICRPSHSGTDLSFYVEKDKQTAVDKLRNKGFCLDPFGGMVMFVNSNYFITVRFEELKNLDSLE